MLKKEKGKDARLKVASPCTLPCVMHQDVKYKLEYTLREWTIS